MSFNPVKKLKPLKTFSILLNFNTEILLPFNFDVFVCACAIFNLIIHKAQQKQFPVCGKV